MKYFTVGSSAEDYFEHREDSCIGHHFLQRENAVAASRAFLESLTDTDIIRIRGHLFSPRTPARVMDRLPRELRYPKHDRSYANQVRELRVVPDSRVINDGDYPGALKLEAGFEMQCLEVFKETKSITGPDGQVYSRPEEVREVVVPWTRIPGTFSVITMHFPEVEILFDDDPALEYP
jgi:hypothetical protein